MRYRTGLMPVLVGAMLVAACSTATVDEPQNDSTNATSTTVAAAIQDATGEPSEGDDPIVNTPTPTTPPLSTERTYDGETYPTELTGLVTGAITDLADHLGVDADSVLVISVEEVVWPNGGLGCPMPDMKFTQLPEDGLRILLTHDGTQYEYRSGGSIPPFLCLPELIKESNESVTGGGAPSGEPGSSTEDTLQTETTKPVEESIPTEQPGGPGGEPDV